MVCDPQSKIPALTATLITAADKNINIFLIFLSLEKIFFEGIILDFNPLIWAP